MRISNTRFKQFALIAVVAVGVGSATAYTFNYSTIQLNNTTSASLSALVDTSGQPSPAQTKETTIRLKGQTGATALDILRSQADIRTERSSFGEFVTSINGVEADGISRLWSFYVDGKLANEDAHAYKTSAGEHIEWRIEDI